MKRESEELQRKILLPPSIFPNLPTYMTKSLPERRSESTSVQKRFKRQYDAAELEATEFLAADEVTTLEELDDKLACEDNLPKDVLRIKSDNKLTLYCLKENDFGQLVVKYSLKIEDDLQFSMWCYETKVPLTKALHIFRDRKVNSCSGVVNVLYYKVSIISTVRLTYNCFYLRIVQYV